MEASEGVEEGGISSGQPKDGFCLLLKNVGVLRPDAVNAISYLTVHRRAVKLTAVLNSYQLL